MTGIVLCDIGGGLVILPERLPDGIVGDDTPVTLYTRGAVGNVTWDIASLRHGRTLTDHGDGTATITGAHTRATYSGRRVRVQCSDSVGQLAELNHRVFVRFPVFPSLTLDPVTRTIRVVGGPEDTPDEYVTNGFGLELWSWHFGPPLVGTSAVISGAHNEIATLSGAPYTGEVTASRVIDIAMPEEFFNLTLHLDGA